MYDHELDRTIGAIARRQHGVLSLRQAQDAGATKAMIATRLRVGGLVRLSPRVLAVASHPATWQRQFKAAELGTPGSALADRSAAVIHGLEGFRVLRPTVVAPPSANTRSGLATVRRAATIHATTVDGIRVTTLPRTLFDLLACSPLPQVERAIDDCLVTRRLGIAALAAVERVATASRLANAGTWRALVEERSADAWVPSSSELEGRLYRLLDQLPDLVEVQRQATPPWWKAATHRVDAYLPGWRLIVEADGRRWHTRLADFDRDQWRDNLAAAHGHLVIRFTHLHLTCRPAEALEVVLAAGRHAAALAHPVPAPPAA